MSLSYEIHEFAKVTKITKKQCVYISRERVSNEYIVSIPTEDKKSKSIKNGKSKDKSKSGAISEPIFKGFAGS